MKIEEISATGNFQKETGDKYVIAVDDNNKAKDGYLVLNVFGLGSWNVVKIIENGKYIDKKIVAEGLGKEEAFTVARNKLKDVL